MIRFILTAVFLLLFLVLGLPILAVEYFIRKKYIYAADISQLRIVQWAFHVILYLSGIELTVVGEENVPKDISVLYVGNHRSYFDIIITYARCPRPTGYVAKDSMIKVPLLSLWMKRLHCLFINREDVKEGLKTILEGISLIKNGVSMCIFPEGTRGEGKDELDMLEFKEGSLKMAEKSGCPIIPMAITGSSAIFEDHMPFIKKTKVVLQYGKPIIISELEKEEKRHLGHYTKGKIEQMLLENRTYLSQKG
ncbi:MAG: lysophospholipid acyltransferase family protein [Lachnospiraceae bacterium]